MSSRDNILAAVKANQPETMALPVIDEAGAIRFEDAAATFQKILEGIGGTVKATNDLNEIAYYIKEHFTEGNRYVTVMDELPGIEKADVAADAHELDGVEVAVIKGTFGVAENAAIWVTAATVKVRVLPFICQHLVVVLNKKDIFHNMHQAYTAIGDASYDFGVFIAGPSKTADIEQSLVLGAHGPKSLTVFLM